MYLQSIFDIISHWKLMFFFYLYVLWFCPLKLLRHSLIFYLNYVVKNIPLTIKHVTLFYIYLLNTRKSIWNCLHEFRDFFSASRKEDFLGKTLRYCYFFSVFLRWVETSGPVRFFLCYWGPLKLNSFCFKPFTVSYALNNMQFINRSA